MPARDHRDKPTKRRARSGSARIAAEKLPDIALLSDDELTALAAVIEQELASRRQQKRKDFFANMRAQAQALGVAPEELAAELGRKAQRSADERSGPGRRAAGRVTDRRTTVAPKYRNPNNPSQTWAGRGVKPRWMQALLAQGQTMDDFRIQS